MFRPIAQHCVESVSLLLGPSLSHKYTNTQAHTRSYKQTRTCVSVTCRHTPGGAFAGSCCWEGFESQAGLCTPSPVSRQGVGVGLALESVSVVETAGVVSAGDSESGGPSSGGSGQIVGTLLSSSMGIGPGLVGGARGGQERALAKE